MRRASKERRVGDHAASTGRPPRMARQPSVSTCSVEAAATIAYLSGSLTALVPGRQHTCLIGAAKSSAVEPARNDGDVCFGSLADL